MQRTKKKNLHAFIEPLEHRVLLAAQELLANPSFSSGTASWNLTGDFYAGTNFSNYRTSPGYAAGGVTSAGAGKDGANGSMYQQFTIPASATSVTASWWYQITSAETTTSSQYDTMQVDLLNSSGQLLTNLANYSNLNKATNYQQSASFNLAAYVGQTVRLRFLATTDSISNNTIFRLDDVSVSANVPTTDTTNPTISSFNVTPQSGSLGQAFTGSYTVSDTGGSGLKQVVLRRTSGDGSANDPGWHDIQTITIAGNTASGSFSADTPSSAGTYWYGMAVFDNANNSNDERAAGLGPLQRSVTPPGTIQSAYWFAPLNKTEGDVATMAAKVTGFATGTQFEFDIYEDDGIISQTRNEYVTSEYGTVFYDSGTNAYYVEATWTTVWRADQFGDPEFFFDVTNVASGVAGTSPQSAELTVAQKVNHVPTAPGTLSSSSVTRTSATVSWGASSDADGNPITYEVQYGRTDVIDGWTSAGTTSGTSKTLTGLYLDSRYTVRVIARDNQGGESAWREQSALFRTQLNTAPTSPGVVTAPLSDLNRTTAKITWAPAVDTDGDPITYEIEYGRNNTLGWTSGGTTTSPERTLTGLTENWVYAVRVRAKDSYGGVSGWTELDPAFRATSAPVIKTADGSPVTNPNTSIETWVVFHGRGGMSWTAGDPIYQLAQAEKNGIRQVLVVDWSGLAAADSDGDGYDFSDFGGEQWIVPMANWLSAKLNAWGFTGSNLAYLNLIGHSWGAVLEEETANRLGGDINSLVALDPAEDAPPPLGTSYDTDNVDFTSSNHFSWAFYSRDGGPWYGLGSNAGNETTAPRADESFVVRNSDHNALVSMFTYMLIHPTWNLSQWFNLNRISSWQPGPWRLNQFSQDATLGGPYEAAIYAISGGTVPNTMTYIKASDGLQITLNESAPDTTPPTPNPSSFATVPFATGPNSIQMTATAASDPSGVQYFFHNMTISGHDSGWQDSATFTDTGLTANTLYGYQVRTRDKSAAQNAGTYSATVSTTTQVTPDTTPPTPNPSSFATAPFATGPNSIQMTATTASDPSGVQYFFHNVTITGHDSGWQDSATFTDTGLSASSTYTYQVQTRDKSPAQNVGTGSNLASATTNPDSTPPTITMFNVSPTSATVGSQFVISYTVSDTGGSGLKQIQLWRANIDGSRSDSSWIPISPDVSLPGSGPDGGSFFDTPPSPGNYWYGIHVYDNAGNYMDERIAGLGPIQATITPLCSFRDIWIGHAGTTIDVDGDGYARSFEFDWSLNGSRGCYVKIFDYQGGGGDMLLKTNYSSFLTVDTDDFPLLLSHGVVNFKFELYDEATNTLQQAWTPANDSDLGNVKVELSSQDPFTPHLYGATIRDKIDRDADGYSSRIDIGVAVDAVIVGSYYLKLYKYGGGLADEYLFKSSLFQTSDCCIMPQSFHVYPDDFPGSLSHGTVDFKLELYSAFDDRLTDTLTPSKEPNLANVKVELTRQEISPLVGDVNFDRTVTISDFITLASNFNKTGMTWADGDLNGDGVVSISDFIDLASNFGRTLAGIATPIGSAQPALSATAETITDEPVLLVSADPLSTIQQKRHSHKQHPKVLRHHQRPRGLIIPMRY